MLALVGSLLMVPLLLVAVAAWVFHESYQDDVEYIIYVEELTPVVGFPGEIVDAQEFYDEESREHWFHMEWEDGTSLFVALPGPQGD